MQNENVTRRTVDDVVISLCLDYGRRKRCIEEGFTSYRTDTEHRYLNFYIFDAACEVAGERYAEVFINEIGRRTGFAKTSLEGFSEITYKGYKRRIIDLIAKKLHLID